MSVVVWDGRTLSADSRSVIRHELNNQITKSPMLFTRSVRNNEKISLPKIEALKISLSELGCGRSKTLSVIERYQSYVLLEDGIKKILPIQKHLSVMFSMGLDRIKAVGVAGPTTEIINYFKKVKAKTLIDFVELDRLFKENYSLLLIGEKLNFVYDGCSKQLEVYEKEIPIQIGWGVLKELFFLKKYRTIFTSQEIVQLAKLYYPACGGKTLIWKEGDTKTTWDDTNHDLDELFNRFYNTLDTYLRNEVKERRAKAKRDKGLIKKEKQNKE